MKKTLILVVSVLVLGLLGFFFVARLRGEVIPATSGGRYQLLLGTYTFSTESSGVKD